MKKGPPSFPRLGTSRSEGGSALIIVLSFVVLLTVVVLAMLSHSLLNRSISNASSNVTKTDLYAHGAIDQIIGDLRQEIVAGSTSSGSGASTIYRPSSVTASVPYNSGPYSQTVFNSTFPNLVKESTHSVSFEPYDSPTPRAAAVSTTSLSVDGASRIISGSADGTSLNGHYVSVTRWNKPLLLPKATVNGGNFTVATSGTLTITDTGTTTSAVAQPTPISSFVAPDWILTTANSSNPNPTTWPASPATTIENPKSASYVVGRYAYTIYNEGGLLDANVAGGPWAITTASPPTSAIDGLSASQLALYYKKGPSAFADLSQLPGFADLTTLEGASNYRGQYIVDSLVGWRNAASAASSSGLQTSPFPTYKFSVSSDVNIGNYFTYLLGLSSNFMSTGYTGTYYSTGTYTSPGYPDSYSGQVVTDQVFAGRQQMINFFVNTIAKAIGTTSKTTEQAYLQDAMMYLGTFSRTLNQPSYWPDPNRPTIAGAGYPTANPPVGNNAYQNDNTFNPPFKSITAASGFTRNDGTTAVAGEPLVKKRFALNRLAWITYKGPSATLYASNTNDSLFQQYQAIYTGSTSGTPAAWLPQLWNEGTTTNIKSYFGLTWNNGPAGSLQPGGYWVYDPDGDEKTNTSGMLIKTLAQVAAKNREPNFFELLKAAICAGSLAKGGAPDLEQNTGAVDYICQLYRDTQVDYQIFQIGANIINQASPANYPTQIVVYNNASAFTTNAGPFSSNESFFGVVDLPYLYATDYLVIETKAPVESPTPSSNAQTTPAVTVTNSGQAVMLQIPIVWNPNTPGASAYLSGLTPTKFRIGVSDWVASPQIASTESQPLGYYQLSPQYVSTGTTTTTTSGSTTTVTTTTTGANDPSPFTVLCAPWGNQNSSPSPWPQGSPGYGTSGSLSAVNPVSVTDTTATNTGLLDFGPATSSSTYDTEIYFDGDQTGTTTLFREPTPLMYSTGSGSSTSGYGSGTFVDSNNILAKVGGFSSLYVTDALNTSPKYLGFFECEFPLCWTSTTGNNNVTTTVTTGTTTTTTNTSAPFTTASTTYEVNNVNMINANAYGITYSLEYQVGSSWIPFQQRNLFGQSDSSWSGSTFSTTSGTMSQVPTTSGGSFFGSTITWDPRALRWEGSNGESPVPSILSAGPPLTLYTARPGIAAGSAGHTWAIGGVSKDQNLTRTSAGSGDSAAFVDSGGYVVDPDLILRPPMGAYVQPISTGTTGAANNTTGLPEATVYTGTTASAATVSNRPIILHRPFRSVAELGYVFSDTPWRNIDFFTPESGDSALLDTFCIDEDYRPDAVSAGRVDLNTKQAPVIQALLYGTYRDEITPTTNPALIQSEAVAISQALVSRTTGNTTVMGGSAATGPLSNIGDLVGRYTSGAVANPNNSSSNGGIGEPYDGFTADLTGNPTTGSNPLYSGGGSSVNNVVQRFLETTMRSLSDSGQAGTWNLLIDVVAQSGHYPSSASSLSNFLVEGERRYWVHVSIDRQTGQIIDENIEPVNE